MIDRDPQPHLDTSVTLKGACFNAHSGAVVLLADRVTVYVDGLQSWPSNHIRKPVVARGTLRNKSLAPDPTVGPNGEVSHGMEGNAWVLEEASWELV